MLRPGRPAMQEGIVSTSFMYIATGSSTLAPIGKATVGLVGDVKLQLEAGERELWLIERHGVLEHRLGMIPVRGTIEDALRAAKEQLDG